MKHDYHTPGTTDAQSTGSLTMGFVGVHKFGGSAFVHEVVIKADGHQNPSFNVIVDGSLLFSPDQPITQSGQGETFVPTQNRHISGASAEMIFSVTGSASVANNMQCTVLVDDQKG